MDSGRLNRFLSSFLPFVLGCSMEYPSQALVGKCSSQRQSSQVADTRDTRWTVESCMQGMLVPDSPGNGASGSGGPHEFARRAKRRGGRKAQKGVQSPECPVPAVDSRIIRQGMAPCVMCIVFRGIQYVERCRGVLQGVYGYRVLTLFNWVFTEAKQLQACVPNEYRRRR